MTSILRAVSSHEPAGATTSELARTAGLARPTTHRFLTALHHDGFLDRDADGRWHLGPELYLLRTAATRRYDVTEIAQPFVRALSVMSGESAFFSARRGSETVCLLREEGSFPIRSHVLYEGIRFPLGVASAGMAILAHLNDADITAHLAATDLESTFGPEHSSDRVKQRIEQTRSLGYAVNPGLLVEGSWGIGAAVFDTSDRPQWALSLTGIEQRFPLERQASLGAALLQASRDLTQAIARTGNSR